MRERSLLIVSYILVLGFRELCVQSLPVDGHKASWESRFYLSSMNGSQRRCILLQLELQLSRDKSIHMILRRWEILSPEPFQSIIIVSMQRFRRLSVLGMQCPSITGHSCKRSNTGFRLQIPSMHGLHAPASM